MLQLDFSADYVQKIRNFGHLPKKVVKYLIGESVCVSMTPLAVADHHILQAR